MAAGPGAVHLECGRPCDRAALPARHRRRPDRGLPGRDRPRRTGGSRALLTIDFNRLPVSPGDRVLDLGCGAGRHAFEAFRRGAHVVAADLDSGELTQVRGMFAAMRAEGEAAPPAAATSVTADATKLPFPDDSFDRVIAAEILEHVPRDRRALAE